MYAPEEIFSIYSTFPNILEAENIVHSLIAEKLIACANLVPAIKSIYVWEGKIEESSEVLGFFKTSGLYVDAVQKRIEELHSYEVPSILVLPILGGSEPYLDWIRNSL